MSDQHRHTLEIDGYKALLAEHCELVDRLAAVEARIDNMAAELRRLGCTVTVEREIVADLGHGWQIVRVPDSETLTQ